MSDRVDARTLHQDRLPPGQIVTRKWPVDEPGFWEQNGYHMRGDPWEEERYGRPDPARMRRGPR